MKKQLTLKTQKVSKLSQHEKSVQNGKITPMLTYFTTIFK
jgi:predicted SnoaL-like aldol condensation-catalyzing enzyme